MYRPSWFEDEDMAPAPAPGVAGKPGNNSSVYNAAKEEVGPTWTQQYVGNQNDRVDLENPGIPSAKQPTSKGEFAEPAEFVGTPDEIRTLTRWKYILAACYVVAGLNLAIASGLSLVAQTDVSLVFFALYVIFFAGIFICFECAIGVRF